VAGTLIRLQTLLKCDFIKPAWKKHQMSFLKKGAKMDLENECTKIGRLLGPHL
jgi:hypothetical protein